MRSTTNATTIVAGQHANAPQTAELGKHNGNPALSLITLQDVCNPSDKCLFPNTFNPLEYTGIFKILNVLVCFFLEY